MKLKAGTWTRLTASTKRKLLVAYVMYGKQIKKDEPIAQARQA